MKKKPKKPSSLAFKIFKSPPLLKGLLVIALCLILASGIYLVRTFNSSQSTKTAPQKVLPKNTVMLQRIGFYPFELKIKKGETVTFVTDINKPFWPASNSHPVHEIMPAFDAEHPVNSNDSYKFTFDQTGRWGYHDHLYPQFRGVIIVEDEGSLGKFDINCTNLEGLDDFAKKQCFDRLLSDTLREKGVLAALEQVRVLYRTEPLFIQDGCHRQVHVVGEAFYGEYLNNKDMRRLRDLTSETVYCGFGFWHGFLEHLFRERPTPAFTKSFCDSLEQQLKDKIPNIRSTCYHGMGHGFIANPPPQSIWGNPQAMIDPALDICDTISKDQGEVKECHMGTINVLLDWISERSYGLKPNDEDPMWVCRNPSIQKTKLRSEACYAEFAMRIHGPAKEDIVLMGQWVNEIEDDSIAGVSMHSAVASIIETNLELTDYGKYILDCYKVEQRIQESCIEGLIHGLLAHGEPGSEYVKAMKFCQQPELNDEQEELCYKKLFSWFEFYYTKVKIASICQTIDEQYRKYCNNKGREL